MSFAITWIKLFPSGNQESPNLLANRPSPNFQNSTGFPDKLREPSRTYAMQPKNACTPRHGGCTLGGPLILEL
jgi:hypothetical protein